MAERDLMRFLDKVAQLKQLVDSLEADPHRREQLAGCSSHNQVVQLANSWGYEIGRRWGEPEPSALKSDNLLLSPLPETGEELERVLHCGDGWRLVLITSNEACCPDGLWMDQVEHEWVMVLKGSAQLRIEDPYRLIDLSAGDHLHLPPRCRHRVERTDPAPGTIWLALHWVDSASPGLNV